MGYGLFLTTPDDLINGTEALMSETHFLEKYLSLSQEHRDICSQCHLISTTVPNRE